MSFILDALKKSENDRQRQSGPALFEVRVPPPRSKLPMLAIVIVSLLVVNLGVVGWLMLRKPASVYVGSRSSTLLKVKVFSDLEVRLAPSKEFYLLLALTHSRC